MISAPTIPNDADGDGICGDVDTCPYDSENDADEDGQCGDVDVVRTMQKMMQMVMDYVS